MATTDLGNRRILAIVTNYGVEQDELVVPVKHLRDHGAQVSVAAVSDDEIRTLVGDKEPGDTVRPDLTLADVDPAAYDLLLVPGGTLNADTLRLQDASTRIVSSFAASGRPVAAICHGPWALIEGGYVQGKTLTSYASLKTDITNAGGSWVDKSVVRDDEGGWPLITSRNPDDLPDFLREIDAVLTES
ncbi:MULTISPECIES: type 1 glutamine amidotransferase domain-containing protein [Streptomyces]|uniref:type 1 glutamine amidotransferase domain-containing protein n=1 Tax=Streptomyces TaxID=1883 RepID=UPI0004C8A92B|nr:MULTISPECIES: type 1 glutamine amidotransferase domain-containing protein [Streptomyces]NDZ64345.1 type 1 glutamine amidotransferase [Streptomyces cyaneofuscatus]ONI50105.1 General stress protein 18 [Streptomyces sp. IB2014 011-1]RDV48648.1 type 1 glutamine amidotransferase [Streptomyces sp. IB2014 011-12]